MTSALLQAVSTMVHDAITIGADGERITLMWCGRYMAKTLEAVIFPLIERDGHVLGNWTRINSVGAYNSPERGRELVFGYWTRHESDRHGDDYAVVVPEDGEYGNAYREWCKHAVAKDEHETRPWWHHAE